MNIDTRHLCWRCGEATATMRILHGGEPIEGILACHNCWQIWEQLVQGGPPYLICEICQQRVDMQHVTVDTLTPVSLSPAD